MNHPHNCLLLIGSLKMKFQLYFSFMHETDDTPNVSAVTPEQSDAAGLTAVVGKVPLSIESNQETMAELNEDLK